VVLDFVGERGAERDSWAMTHRAGSDFVIGYGGTADPTKPSTISHPSPSKTCTTLTEPPSPRPESQQPESPDNPG
jgi:hypothetical protein